MKFSLAIVATTFAVAAEAGKIGRRLSFEKIASYKPESQVSISRPVIVCLVARVF